MNADATTQLLVIGLGLSTLCGFLLLWTGLVRWAGRTDDSRRLRLGRIFTAAGVLVYLLTTCGLWWIASTKIGDMKEYWQVMSPQMPDALPWVIGLGEAVILTMVHRRYHHRLTTPGSRLLGLWMVVSWLSPFHIWWMRHLNTFQIGTESDTELVWKMFTSDQLMELMTTVNALPWLVLGWLLATGRLLKAEAGASTESS